MKKIGIIAVYKEDEHGPFNRLYHTYIDAIESSEGYVSYIIPCNTRHIKHFIQEMDGFILPGGDDICPSVYGRENICSQNTFALHDRAMLSIVDKIVESKKPLLGICRGMQLLNIYFGGTLHQDIPESSVHNQAQKAKQYVHEIDITFGTQLHNLLEAQRLGINSIHHQAIEELGKGLIISAKSDDGYIEAIEHTGYPQILAVQWHPEILESQYHLLHGFFGK